jgi:predicted RNase H-like nuclease (RuvC/YqgF family)
MGDIKELREKCRDLETRVDALEAEKSAVEKELKEYVNTNQALKQQLGADKEQNASSDRRSVEAWKELQSMNSQISSLEDQLLS